MSSSASSAVRENASGVLYDLLTDSAGAGLLEKAVFSKCRDRAVVRIVLTLRLVRNNVVLQAETLPAGRGCRSLRKSQACSGGAGKSAAGFAIRADPRPSDRTYRRLRPDQPDYNGWECRIPAFPQRCGDSAGRGESTRGTGCRTASRRQCPPKNRHCRTRSGQTAHSDRCRAVSHPFGSQRCKRSCSRQETAEIPPDQPFSGTDPGYGICLTRHGMPAYLRPVLWEKLPLLRRIPLFHRYPAPGGAHGGRGHEGGRHGCLQ